MQTLKSIGIMVASWVLTWLSFRLMTETSMANIILVSILVHEGGHWAALRWFGEKSMLYGIPFLGGVAVFDKNSTLNRYQMAVVALAGPFASFTLIVVGIMMDSSAGTRLASINALLVALNLLPFFIFDGHRFVKEVFASMKESHELLMLLVVSVVLFFAVREALSLHLFSRYFPLFFMLLWLKSTEDNPKEAYKDGRMTNTQVAILMVAYVVMFIASAFMMRLLPPA